MISTSRALSGLVALMCSIMLVLGFVDRDPEPAARAESGAVAVESGAADTEAEPGVMQPEDESSEGMEPAAVPDSPISRPARPLAPHAPKPWVQRRVCRVTAYCDRGITASGTNSGVGQCAAPGDIPFGSKIYIPALRRTFVVTDRTHPRFRHNTVDIFIPSEEKCVRFGRSFLECQITPPPKAGGRLVSR